MTWIDLQGGRFGVIIGDKSGGTERTVPKSINLFEQKKNVEEAMLTDSNYSIDVNTCLYDCGNRMKRRKMMALLPDSKDKIVVNAGCGIDDFWQELKWNNKLEYAQYFSLDLCQSNLIKANQLADDSEYSNKNRILIKADVCMLPIADEKVDILICSDVLEHLDDRKAMKEIKRVLKKSGHALITVPYLGKPEKRFQHLRHYSLDTFRQLTRETGLTVQCINLYGRFHLFTWVKLKRTLYVIYGIWKRISGSKINYYESILHRYIFMPVWDVLLCLDDLFSSPYTIFGKRGEMMARLKKE